jgi:hypothetical protein
MFKNISKIDNNDLFDYNLKLLAALLDCRIEELYIASKDMNGLMKLVETLQWINEEMPVYDRKDFDVDGKKYKLFTKFREITFGDWISIETLLKNDKDNYLTNIIAILLKDEDGKEEEDIIGFSKKLNDLRIVDIINVYKNFTTFRNNIYKMYDGFFKISENKEELESEIDKRAGLYKNYDLSRWQWMLMVEKMCKELNYTPDRVYDLTLISALNWSAMFYEKTQYEIEQQKRANKKIRR